MTSIETREQRLREIAHQIWEEEGRPSGDDERHWEMAKEILRKDNHEDADRDEHEDAPGGAREGH